MKATGTTVAADLAATPLAVPFTVIVDTREQLAYEFAGLHADAVQHGRALSVTTERGTLRQGDYSIKGLESKIAIERKSAADLFGTLGKGRRRFVAELERLSRLDWSAVIVEADWRDILNLWPPGLSHLRRWLEDRRWATVNTNAELSERLRCWVRDLESVMGEPPPFSRLNPKTIFRSIVAWRQRYPNVHWSLCPNRRFAEIETFRILERYWKEATK